MDCTQYHDLLIEKIYDEIEPDRALRLEAHLVECADCRDVLERLDRTRHFLRDTPLDAPRVTPSVIVARPPQRLRPWMAFAAGLAIATALVATGVAIGMNVQDAGAGPIASNGFVSDPADSGAGAASPLAPADYVTDAELRDSLDRYQRALDRRLDSLNSTPVAAGAGDAQRISREELDRRLRQFAASFSVESDAQLERRLAGLSDWQSAADRDLEEMKRVLMWIVASQDPRLSEQ